VSLTPLPIERITSGPGAGSVVVRVEQLDKSGARRPVVVLDHELLQRLEKALAAVPRDAAGLVLASASERVFVAGADLKTISEWDDDQLERYLAYGSRVFGVVAEMPFPTAAAINGAALGGGLELAMHCDALIGCSTPKPFPIGLPEAGLSLCPGWGGTNLLPARMDAAEAIRRTACGTNMTSAEAEQFGLFDQVAPGPAELIPAALVWIEKRAGEGRIERDGAPSRWIGRPSVAARVLKAMDDIGGELPRTESSAAVVGAINAGLSAGWNAAVETERRELVRLRHTAPAKSALAAFFAKSAGKT
jgi:enoyl-CoA hydratase